MLTTNPNGAVQRPQQDNTDELSKLYDREDELETRLATAELQGASGEADKLTAQLETLRALIAEVEDHDRARKQ